MFKKNLIKSIIFGTLAVVAFSSCTKEDVHEPVENPVEPGQTIIFIRAVDKDSSSVESEQLLLR